MIVVHQKPSFIPSLPSQNKEQVITGNVTKDDLMNLYTRHMLKLGSESGKIYDKLRAASNGVCPLCGIHGVATLDHYLPKARYPLFSVNPKILYLPARIVMKVSQIVYLSMHQI